MQQRFPSYPSKGKSSTKTKKRRIAKVYCHCPHSPAVFWPPFFLKSPCLSENAFGLSAKVPDLDTLKMSKQWSWRSTPWNFNMLKPKMEVSVWKMLFPLGEFWFNLNFQGRKEVNQYLWPQLQLQVEWSICTLQHDGSPKFNHGTCSVSWNKIIQSPGARRVEMRHVGVQELYP